MKFRLKAFGLHLLVSASVLALVLGSLYLGWYRWPGWYVVGASSVVAVLAGVDLTLGPLMTLIVASPTKPRRDLRRDVGIIATVQLCALVYGAISLWTGRPLYYAFATSELELVQAYEVKAQGTDAARVPYATLLPHWYSLPRWIWAPLPTDPKESVKIVMSVLEGGDDVVNMPRYFKPWDQGLPTLRQQLKPVDKVAYFSKPEKQALKERMRALGLNSSASNAIPLTGRGDSLLAVFDPASLKMLAILAPPSTAKPGYRHWSAERYLKALVPRHTSSHGQLSGREQPASAI